MNMEFKRKLPAPRTVKDMYPVTEEMAQNKRENDRQIQAVITGGDPRLMLLIGPCSADREDAVLEYAARLRTLQEQVKDKLLLVPRIYSNKPRTTGDGYKGMLHQPDPNGQPDMLKGLIAIRKMHMKVLEQTGFSSADELLYPENYYYLSDILSYAAIGARSVEDQQHRLIASGLDVPVGMKNPTSGDLSVMMNSILAAQHAHTFLFSQWEVHSKGNPLAHAILRGSVNKYGRSLPNYHYEDLRQLYELYAGSGLKTRGDHRHKPLQLRQAVGSAGAHCQGGAPQHPPQRGHRRHGKGPDDRVLPAGRLPEAGWRRVRPVHHGSLHRLGKDGAAGAGAGGAAVIGHRSVSYHESPAGAHALRPCGFCTGWTGGRLTGELRAHIHLLLYYVDIFWRGSGRGGCGRKTPCPPAVDGRTAFVRALRRTPKFY